MDVAEYADFDATGLVRLIKNKEVSGREVLDAAARALDEVNPALNALVDERFEEPLAHNADGPFAGVPFLIKDFVLHAADVPVGMGSRYARGVVFDHDTDLMSRFRAAGLATIGRTATPEFGFSVTTEPAVNGPVRNPWDVSKSAGGSSGGAAALVAARAVPIAHGNDGGGSIRVPAAHCGLVGLKPTRARTPVGPDDRDPLAGWGVEFALTRSVRDAAALLDAVHGPGVGDKYTAPPPAGPFATDADTAPGTLRIAYTTTAWTGVPIADDCVRAVEDAARLLESLGHQVETASPAVDGEQFLDVTRVTWCGFLAAGLDSLADIVGRQPAPAELEATVAACVEHGRRLSATDMFAAERAVNTISRCVGRFMLDYDVLVTPVAASPPWPLGVLNSDDASLDAQGWIEKMFGFAPFTGLFNLTGQPAMSLPLGESSDGLPVGVQLVARYGDEATLFRLGAQLERAAAWDARRPTVCAGRA